jgi:anti-sigma B factor antagonist
MPSAPLAIERITAPGEELRVLRLSGSFSGHGILQFQRLFREGPPQDTVLNLSEVPYIDSAGLGALIKATVSCSEAGKTVALAGACGLVRAVLKTARVEQLFQFHASVSDAKSAFKSATRGPNGDDQPPAAAN